MFASPVFPKVDPGGGWRGGEWTGVEGGVEAYEPRSRLVVIIVVTSCPNLAPQDPEPFENLLVL